MATEPRSVTSQSATIASPPAAPISSAMPLAGGAVAGRQDDARAFGCEPPRDGLADSARGSGDERDFAVEPERVSHARFSPALRAHGQARGRRGGPPRSADLGRKRKVHVLLDREDFLDLHRPSGRQDAHDLVDQKLGRRGAGRDPDRLDARRARPGRSPRRRRPGRRASPRGAPPRRAGSSWTSCASRRRGSGAPASRAPGRPPAGSASRSRCRPWRERGSSGKRRFRASTIGRVSSIESVV